MTKLHFGRDTSICPLAQLYRFTTHMLSLIYCFMKSIPPWDTELFTYHLPWITGPLWRQQVQNSYFCLKGRHPNITWFTEDSTSPIIRDLYSSAGMALCLVPGNVTLNTAARPFEEEKAAKTQTVGSVALALLLLINTQQVFSKMLQNPIK